MPAYTKPESDLIVVFRPGGEAPDERHRARDAREAARTVINLMVARREFHPGEVILCLRADDRPPELPEASRAAHFS